MPNKTGIEYTFPADCPVPQMRGVTCYGGKQQKAKIDGKCVDVVAFSSPLIGGLTVTAKIENHPALKAIVDAANATAAAELMVRRSFVESSVPGLAEYESAAKDVSIALSDYERASGRGYPAKEAAALSAAENKLNRVHDDYPATAAWRKIVAYSQASNVSKHSAGLGAIKAVEAGENVFMVAARMEAEWSEQAVVLVSNS